MIATIFAFFALGKAQIFLAFLSFFRNFAIFGGELTSSRQKKE